MGKIVDPKRMQHETKERNIAVHELEKDILHCVRQALRSFPIFTAPWQILVEQTAPNKLRVIAWLPENITLPGGLQRPVDAVAFYHSEGRPIERIQDVNFHPIAREVAKGISQRYKGER